MQRLQAQYQACMKYETMRRPVSRVTLEKAENPGTVASIEAKEAKGDDGSLRKIHNRACKAIASNGATE